MNIRWYNITMAAFLSFILFISFTGKSLENTLEANTRALPQTVQAVTLKGFYSFADEPLPMEKHDVQERLDRELLVNSYRHSATIQYLKLMHRHFPQIEAILNKEGVPDDFKYLAVAESGLRNVTSHANAVGFWQFLSGTAKEYNLIVNSEVDERYHVEKATYAACKHLKKLKNNLGSWTLAAAAYNRGLSGLKKEMNNQGELNYYDLNLNQETMRYIFRIVALKDIYLNQNEYGYFLYDEDKYQPQNNTYQVLVEGPVSKLSDFAHRHNVSYRDLKIYNPWLRSSKLTNSAGKSYYITFPKDIQD